MSTEQDLFEFEPVKPIKGFPELHWAGKRPYTATHYFPAQLKERYGEEQDGWINRIYWGDNLMVMGHLLKEFRGKIDLIYIDPPFDDKADYKKTIEVRGQKAASDSTSFEEKQYGDIWTNDEYLQFMYERLIVMRDLLSDTGSIYLHCDWHKSHYLRMLMDEIFGPNNLINEIAWCYATGGASKEFYGRKHDTLLYYRKNCSNYFFNPELVKEKRTEKSLKRAENQKGARISLDNELKLPTDVWNDINALNPMEVEREDYPTQKPAALLEKIILATSKPNDIIFDCFMGSGTTQAVSMKLGRRFIGADINLGAIQTTTKRLLVIAKELTAQLDTDTKIFTSFEVYNVNNYEFFRNPLEAKDLLIDHFGIQKYDGNSLYDGEIDGRMVKIMPINRIASKADIASFISILPYKVFEERKDNNPGEPVEKFTVICMGHEPDLHAEMQKELLPYKVDIEIVDILRDKAILELKREAEADVQCRNSKVIIRQFYPLNLMQKLSLDKKTVSDWKELVDSVLIDFNYAGAEMEPSVIDVPDKNKFVKGEYDIPKNAGRIKVKITDLLSESLEVILE